MQLLHRNVNDRVIKKGGTPATFPLHLHDVWPADYSPVEKFTFSWLNYIFFLLATQLESDATLSPIRLKICNCSHLQRAGLRWSANLDKMVYHLNLKPLCLSLSLCFHADL